MTDIPSWARPGVKVVCVDGVWWNYHNKTRTVRGPEKGKIYTISEVLVRPDGVYFLLSEWIDGPDPHIWFIAAFRPLVSDLTEEQIAKRKSMFDEWRKVADVTTGVDA